MFHGFHRWRWWRRQYRRQDRHNASWRNWLFIAGDISAPSCGMQSRRAPGSSRVGPEAKRSGRLVSTRAGPGRLQECLPRKLLCAGNRLETRQLSSGITTAQMSVLVGLWHLHPNRATGSGFPDGLHCHTGRAGRRSGSRETCRGLRAIPRPPAKRSVAPGVGNEARPRRRYSPVTGSIRARYSVPSDFIKHGADALADGPGLMAVDSLATSDRSLGPESHPSFSALFNPGCGTSRYPLPMIFTASDRLFVGETGTL